MKTKRIQYYDTYETTLLKAQRYINAVCLRMGQEEHYEDMKQAGREGLWIAHTRFNPDEGKEFHPYAVAYIKGYVLKYLTTNARTIHIPAHIQKDKDFYENVIISASTPLKDEGSFTVGDLIPQEEDDIEEDDATHLIKARLRDYLSELKPRHQQILLMYYADSKSITDIGEEIGISRQGVSHQLELAVQNLQKRFGVEVTKRDASQRYYKKIKGTT